MDLENSEIIVTQIAFSRQLCESLSLNIKEYIIPNYIIV